MENITVNDTLLTGSEDPTSFVDDRTLACSPAPIAVSTVIRESGKSWSRVPLHIGGSFLDSRSTARGDNDDGSNADRSSLGLLPSNCLLEMENDLLRQDSICLPRNTLPVDTPAVTQSSYTNKSQLKDSASSGECNSYSGNLMTTIKKCPQGGASVRGGGSYDPLALFQSVEEVRESRLDDSITTHTDCRGKNANKSNANKPQRRTMPSGSLKSECSEAVTSEISHHVSNSVVGDHDTDGKLFLNEQKEIVHAIHLVELEAEDLEKLEEIFCASNGSSDEEMSCKLVQDGDLVRDGDVSPKPELNTYACVKEKNSKYSEDFIFPNMDGPFKIPLPPSKPLTAQNKMSFGNSVFTSSEMSRKEPEASMIFGDSIQFYQSRSATEWGPSINFGSSPYVGEASGLERERYSTGNQDMNKEGLTDNLPKTAIEFPRTQFKNFDEQDTWLSKPGQPLIIHGESYPFGGFPGDICSDDNKNDLQTDPNPIVDFARELAAEGFGDEDFMVDTEAAAAMLAEDERLFKKDNIVCDEFNLSLGSMRGEDQTFMSMTIGTYMATGSGDVGSLTSYDKKRPELGMSVKSPPSVRPSVPMLSPGEIFSPPQRNEAIQSCAGKSKSLSNSPALLVNTNPEVTSHKRSPQHNSLNDNSEEMSCVYNHSPSFTANSKTLIQSDPVKSSFLSEMQVSQAKSFTHYHEASAKKAIATDETYLQTVVASGTGCQQTVMYKNSSKAEHDSTLGQTMLSFTGLEDSSMNSTCEDITFSSIYKLIEMSDISLSDPGSLILSEYNKKMKEKQEANESKDKTNIDLPEKGQGTDVTSAKVTSQIQSSSKNSHKPVNHCSVNKKDYSQTVMNLQLQTKTNLSLTEAYQSRNKTSDEKSQPKQDAEVPLVDLKLIYQNDDDCLTSNKTSQAVMDAKSDRPSESTNSHESIPGEIFDNQSRITILEPSADCLTTSSLLQSSQQIVCPSLAEDLTRDSSINLESVTVNSQYSLLANTTNMTVSHHKASIARPSLLMEKISQLCVTKSLGNTFSPPENLQQLLSMTVDNSVYDVSDVSLFPSLVHDNTNSMLQSMCNQDKFVSSTPLSAHRPGIQRFANNTQMTEKSILPLITPKAALNILDLPEVVYLPEVCCVLLSHQTSFTITNLLEMGVKCLLTIREVIFRGKRIDNNLCPFELKRQITLSPISSQSVQVTFRPKDQGKFLLAVEVFSQNLTKPQETRTYVLHISACAEFPALKISPVNDEIDFGELLWGNTSCRSVRIQNVGRATVPLRFSIFRKDSALCNFSFYPENSTDVSSISQTIRPVALGSVFSMSLPGRKDGQMITTETVKIYCQTREPQNLSQRFLEKAEKFQAVLSLGVDMPLEDIHPLNQMKLQVTVGMYKLHVDRDTLSISAAPGSTGQDTMKIINSGNIPMHVDITLEPQRDHFSVSTDHVVVPGGGNCHVHVTYTPHPAREDQDDNTVNLMLKNQMTQYYISVIGKIKKRQTKIRSSTSAISFGGVGLGQSQKQKFTFVADDDDDVKIWITNPGSAFKLLKEDDTFVENLELSVVNGKRCTVWIAFFPSEVIGYSADLAVQVLYANRYTIPCSGYGGCSKLLIEEVNEVQTGERWLDLGFLSPGTSIVRKITLRNTGVRCCFIKASFYDVSRQEFQSFRATVMPSSLILPANEATDLLLTINPSQKEVDLCKFGRALVAIIKMTSGDEIMRQHFVSNPGKQSKQLVNDFDIPLTATQREIVNTELKSVSPTMESYSLLKKAMSVIKIGLFGISPDNQNTTPKPIFRVGTDATRSLSQQRSALTAVNPNIKPIDIRKDDWTVTPSEIQLSAGGSQVKDFVQIINFSTKELEFSVEHDEGITVVPSKTVVKPKNTTMMVVHGDLTHFSGKEPAAQCAFIKVHCLQQTKYVKVCVQVTSDTVLSPKPLSLPPSVDRPTHLPTTTATSTVLISHSTLDHIQGTSTRTFSDYASQSSSQSSDGREARSIRIQGSNMAIFPTTEAATKTDQTYFFTNTGTNSLTWELAPFAPAYVKHADNTQTLYRVNYDVFKLSPLTGVLQLDETEKVSIEFLPQFKGYYNQAWCIYDTADGQGSSHRFSIYAKASPSPTFGRGPSEEDIVPQRLSPTHASISPIGSQTYTGFTSQSTDSITYSREPAASIHTTRSSTSLTKGPGASPAIKTAQLPTACQHPTSTLNPGSFQSPVPHSDKELLPPVTTRNQGALSSPTNLKHSSKETNVSLNTMRREDISTVASTSLQSSLSQQPNVTEDGGSSSRSEKRKVPKLKCLHLVHEVIQYPKLHPGESNIQEIHLINPSSEDTQIVVEHEPKSPFLIKHYNFTVKKGKMVMFPVTFKPKRAAKFSDKVIFRDSRSGNSFRTTLDAECVNKLAV